VTVEHNGRALTPDVLADTGSPYTLFFGTASALLGVRFPDRPPETWSVKMLGDEYVAQVETVTLSLPPFDLKWTTKVGFLREPVPAGSFLGILGSRGFFDRWVVSFDYRAHRFYVEEPEGFHRRSPIGLEEQLLYEHSSESDNTQPWETGARYRGTT
jgi:hypothetical protein